MVRAISLKEERKYRDIINKLNKGMEVSDPELEFLDKITQIKIKGIKKNAQKK